MPQANRPPNFHAAPKFNVGSSPTETKIHPNQAESRIQVQLLSTNLIELDRCVA